jgi:antitoxin (DNA-binding transcriptional repressor) of toxin-antitoxin stability system
MKTLGMRDIRASSGVLAEALLEEGEVILTNHGKPFARVVPFEAPVDIPKRKPISMKWLHDQMPMLEEGTDKYIQAERDA